VQQSQSSSQASKYVQLAQIIKPKGLKGQLVAEVCNELFLLDKAVGLDVCIVPPTMRGVRYSKITKVEQKPGSSDYLLSLAGVDNLTDASELTGRYLLVDVDGTGDQWSPLQSNTNAPFVGAAIGRPPATINFTDCNHGNLGQLVRIDKTPAYELWVVDGPHGELLIPAVEEYLVEVTPELITLNLPKGFLDINKKVE
jgi:16S rRNA processing protein RimM